MNAISAAMWQQIGDAVRRYEQDDSLRCLVVRGAGDKAFASGADISEFDSLRTGDAAKLYDVAAKTSMNRLEATAKPTVALIDGYCLGGGVALALCCDIRLASDDARFSIPAARLGLGDSEDAGIRVLARHLCGGRRRGGGDVQHGCAGGLGRLRRYPAA